MKIAEIEKKNHAVIKHKYNENKKISLWTGAYYLLEI